MVKSLIYTNEENTELGNAVNDYGYLDDGRIVSSSISISLPILYNTFADDDGNIDDGIILHIILHELGHTFGLNDLGDPDKNTQNTEATYRQGKKNEMVVNSDYMNNSVMWYEYNSSSQIRFCDFTELDKKNIEYIYKNKSKLLENSK